MTDISTALYPLKFQPIYKEKVWGGRTLEKLGRTLPGDKDTRIGESWELADLGQTSISGGGGGAERSCIVNGPLADQTLHEVMVEFRAQLMGDLHPNAFGEFPLLLKFLDARQNLSVQVHPSPEYARAHDDAFLKSEAWYVLDAEPGAVIYKGVQEGVTPEQFRQAIADNAVEPLLIKIPVTAGDCHYLPSGTCHALGAGVLVAEVQTPSDTTFRVYDWGRPPKAGRVLHVEEALQCIAFGPADVERYEKRTRVQGAHAVIDHLVACEYFRIDRVQASAGVSSGGLTHDQPQVWMVLAGKGEIACAHGPVSVAQGETIFFPAHMPRAELTLQEDATWLMVTFPQATPKRMA